MTLGLGYPVTLQTKRAHCPSLTSSGSGFVTKHGLNFSVSGSIRSGWDFNDINLSAVFHKMSREGGGAEPKYSPGALCQPLSISLMRSMLAMPLGSCDS